MSSLRLLTSGEWNKDPVLIAARRLVFSALGEEFEPVLLGDVAAFLNGTSYDKAHVHAAGALPVIRISNISDPSSQYVRTDEVLPDRFLVATGDLLVSWSASFKSIIWPGPIGLLNQHIFKVTEKDGFDRHFIRHAIEASFEKMQEGVVGIGMMHLRRDAFLSHPIPSIPIALQRHVARYLDAVEKREPRPEDVSHKSLAKAMRAVDRIEAIAGKVEEARRLRREAEKEEETLRERSLTALFPAPCGSVLGDFTKLQTGYAFKSEWFVDEGTRLARNVNVSHGRLDWTAKACVPDDVAPEFGRFALEAGDVLVSLDRPIISTGVKVAQVVQADLPALLLQRVARPIVDEKRLTRNYLFRWLQSSHFVDSIDPGRSNGVPHISHKDIEKIPFACPSLAEQATVVAAFDDLATRFATSEAARLESASQIDALLPAVLDKAFRGEM